MRDLRNKNPEIYRKIVIRTTGAGLWITPSGNVRKLVGGIFARYQEMFGIKIYAVTVLGNHYHLLCRAPGENIDEFEQNVNRELSRRLNYKHDRVGTLWARRYDEFTVITSKDLLDAFLYVTTNMVRHGLVRRTSEWTGLSSYKQLLSGKAERFSFYHYSQRDDSKKVTTHSLKLTPLPDFENMTQSKRKKEISRLIMEREDLIAKERKEKGLGFLGMEAILEVVPGTKPRNSSKSPRPSCYSKYPDKIREYKEQEKLRRDRYRDASEAYRMGDYTVEFPEYTFKPPLHRRPRVEPFGEYLESSFLNQK